MIQYSAAEQRGSSALRWLVRALFVIAGALAGTAAAWAISTATASADTAFPAQPQQEQDQAAPAGDQLTPTTDAIMGTSDDLVLGASNLAGDTSAAAVRVATSGFSADSADQRHQQVAGDVSDAVHEFANTAVLSPAQRVLGTAEHISRQPQDAPRVIGNALTPPQDFLNFLRPACGDKLLKLPALPGTHNGTTDQHQPADLAHADAPSTAAAPAPAGPLGPFTDAVQAQHADAKYGDWQRDRDKHLRGDESGQLPYSPNRGPIAPAGLPLVPGGAATGGHVDGPLLGVPAGALTLVDTHGERAVRFGVRHTPVQPGAQPGVTPD
ncbi:hypothetical protein HFP15_10215 [Amycolatopsis sp. K13G38]|uniref:Uncharacterized protein n=1 Tax=Amycolatopsis acididurans TaxID=2724524 RepID=A0ABX1J4M4_9PSEU|nr:hypothetical protein [Amycolatopsis acididurans]NKQ53257.1 hypothetical protein [Amycolatopsis acididurans]